MVRPKILVVEDDAPLREMYLERLKHAGFEVLSASNGDNAIKEALEKIPSLVLLDLMLPEKGGFSVLQVLKTMPETKDIPIIVLTVFGNEEYKRQALREGAIDYIIKSEVMPQEVVTKIKEVLHLR